MQRGGTVCPIDGRFMAVADVDGGAGADERIDDALRTPFGGPDDQAGPAAAGPQRIGMLAQQAFDILVALQRDGGRQIDASTRIDELLCHAGLIGQGGLVEGREAGGVGRVRVGAEVEQGLERSWLPFQDGQVQRPAAPVRTIHAPVELGGSAAHDVADRVRVCHRDRGEDRVARAVGEQVLCDIRMEHVLEAGRPADHVQLVHVAGADGVGATLDEHADDVEATLLGHEMEWHGLVALVPHIRIGAAGEEQLDELRPGIVHGEVQDRAPAVVARHRGALVHDVGMSVEQRRDLIQVSLQCGGEQGLDGRVAVGGCDGLRSTPDLADELGPAHDSVLTCERELDVAERGCGGWPVERAVEARAGFGVAGPECPEPALHLALQVLDGCAGRDSAGHDDLLPSRLKSAEYRQEEGSIAVRNPGSGGSEAPLPRTGGAPKAHCTDCRWRTPARQGRRTGAGTGRVG